MKGYGSGLSCFIEFKHKKTYGLNFKEDPDLT